jgi:hypothetical protein
MGCRESKLFDISSIKNFAIYIKVTSQSEIKKAGSLYSNPAPTIQLNLELFFTIIHFGQTFVTEIATFSVLLRCFE